MSNITLSQDQQNALNEIVGLLADPERNVLHIVGWAGTGKTTLMKELMRQYKDLMRSIKVLNPDTTSYEPVFTATTNKAVEALEHAMGMSCQTIQSYLGLTVQYDQKGNNILVDTGKYKFRHSKLVIIDEASYVDEILLEYIEEKLGDHCKVIFMGDPYQLPPVNLDYSPAFQIDAPVAQLTQIMRQADDNPIQALSHQLREYAAGGPMPELVEDGVYIQYMEPEDMLEDMLNIFNQPGFNYYQAKVIAFRNATVVGINNLVKERISNTTHFQPGDYAACNQFLKNPIKNIRTDEIVLIKSVKPSTRYDVKGTELVLGNGLTVFRPDDYQDIQRKKDEYWTTSKARFTYIEENWVDLRHVYACTVHKSQGSTFETVYIDLDDFRISDEDMLARLLYVAISRASKRVVLTGNL